MAEAGRLTDPEHQRTADAHGQLRFNYRHAQLEPGEETAFLLRAFERDFEVNGPSVVRVARTTLAGWMRHREHPDPRVRRRFEREARGLATTHAGALWAARRWFRDRPETRRKLDDIWRDLRAACGLRARLAGPLLGRYILSSLRQEDRRLRAGWTYEPPTFYEKNHPSPGDPEPRRSLQPGRWIAPVLTPSPV